MRDSKYNKIRSAAWACTRTLFIVFIIFSATYKECAAFQYQHLDPLAINLSPSAVALDNAENVYVAEASQDMVDIYDNSGTITGRISGLDIPISVAVDSTGKIYICNKGRKNVEVYDKDLNLAYTIGAGNGEFARPSAIALDTAGNIYVADSMKDRISIYNPDGTSSFSFGTSGSQSGQFHYPAALAINNNAGEIIVVDHPLISASSSYGTSSGEGARIQIFDLYGNFRRSYSSFGIGDGKLFRPAGLAVDETGTMYVTDSYFNIVQVFDSNGVFQGTIYDMNDPFRSPLGIAIGKSNRLFIASLNTSKVDVYGIHNFVDMGVSRQSLSFEMQQGGGAPAFQSIEVRNKGNEIINWTASADTGWIILGQTSGI
ncbi:MAG: NHL repeat-containing protein, partial [Nitrospirae bacterium]|nr:NHL repeat-containing protein [Nitrospirota bacterium]